MRIQFTPNHAKTVEVVLWILNEYKSKFSGEEKRFPKEKLENYLFMVDYVSLNKCGLPVTGHRYRVCYPLFDHYSIADDNLYKCLTDSSIKEDSGYLDGLREPDLDYLSKHDIDCLQYCMNLLIASLQYGEIWSKINLQINSHYKNCATWVSLDWYNLIEDSEIREDLEGVAKYIRL